MRAAIYENPPPFIQKQRLKRVTGRKAQGRNYERKGHEFFAGEAIGRKVSYIKGPWIKFESKQTGVRWCQPDALILGAVNGTILEFKYQHTFSSWYQLFELYLPVAQFLFPALSITCCEVVKWFDPHIHCEPKAVLAADPFVSAPGQYLVHIWK